jgi:hypothetical protein
MLAWLGTAEAARAEVSLPGAQLSVRNPISAPQCVEENALAAEVRQQLSERTEVAADPLRIEIAIQQDWSKLVATLRVTGQNGGERQIEASRCAGLLDALAVTIALILDNDVRARRPETTAATAAPDVAAPVAALGSPEAAAAASPTAAVTTVALPASPRAASEHSAGFHLARDMKLRVWVAAGYGASERITSQGWRIETGFQVFRSNWGLMLGGYYQPLHSFSLGEGRLRLTSMGGLLGGCRALGADVRVLLCVQTTLGAQRLRSDGLGEKSPAPLLVFQSGPRFGLETETAALTPSSAMRWIGGIDLVALAGYFRDQYVVDNSSERLDAPLVTFWLLARLALANR